MVNDTGIFLQKVLNGVIHEKVIFGNYYGIYIIDSGNVNVTYNNIGNVRGMKTITLHSNMWLYLNSFTSSFYDI
ncbi:MAG: hypothetical protein EU530_01730 [Promethearchaeota archaeon]|nr:MAG: hypothetical protein EU530_01730 [Candidatus Lokiarchaeota archaeon]